MSICRIEEQAPWDSDNKIWLRKNKILTILFQFSRAPHSKIDPSTHPQEASNQQVSLKRERRLIKPQRTSRVVYRDLARKHKILSIIHENLGAKTPPKKLTYQEIPHFYMLQPRRNKFHHSSQQCFSTSQDKPNSSYKVSKVASMMKKGWNLLENLVAKSSTDLSPICADKIKDRKIVIKLQPNLIKK